MEDYGKFLEMVNEIKNIAVTQGGKLTKEEILSYLGDMQLSEEQLQALYQYLGAHAIEIENYEYKPDKDMLRAMTENEPEEQQEEVLSGEDKEDRSERNRRLYREELDAWNDYNDTVTEEEIVRFLQGERALRDRIIESRLHRVTEMTKEYRKREAPVEELIAEGNLGLLEGMLVIEENTERYLLENGKADLAAFWGTLELEAKLAMERYIDEELHNKDQESAMLAKTNLLHEATKYLAEENGKIPTVQELSSYTHILEEEILQIMGLSEDTKRVAGGNHSRSKWMQRRVTRSLIMISVGFFVAEEEISERNCKTVNAVVCKTCKNTALAK